MFALQLRNKPMGTIVLIVVCVFAPTILMLKTQQSNVLLLALIILGLISFQNIVWHAVPLSL